MFLAIPCHDMKHDPERTYCSSESAEQAPHDGPSLLSALHINISHRSLFTNVWCSWLSQTLAGMRHHQLSVPHVRGSTPGSCAFSVAWPTVWNLLPDCLPDSAIDSRVLCRTWKHIYSPDILELWCTRGALQINMHLQVYTVLIDAFQIKSNKKKNLYSAVYSTDSEALGGRIKWGRRNDTDKF